MKKKCLYCGKTIEVGGRTGARKFCNKTCRLKKGYADKKSINPRQHCVQGERDYHVEQYIPTHSIGRI